MFVRPSRRAYAVINEVEQQTSGRKRKGARRQRVSIGDLGNEQLLPRGWRLPGENALRERSAGTRAPMRGLPPTWRRTKI